MAIRFFLFGVFGFILGGLTVMASMQGLPVIRHHGEAKPPAVRPFVANDEFEAIERRLRDPRDREWSLTQDMQPCFPGSRLCFLLSGATAPSDRQPWP